MTQRDIEYTYNITPYHFSCRGEYVTIMALFEVVSWSVVPQIVFVINRMNCHSTFLGPETSGIKETLIWTRLIQNRMLCSVDNGHKDKSNGISNNNLFGYVNNISALFCAIAQPHRYSIYTLIYSFNFENPINLLFYLLSSIVHCSFTVTSNLLD